MTRAVQLLGGIIAVLMTGMLSPARADECTSGKLPKRDIPTISVTDTSALPDLVVSGPCTVDPGDYYYGAVNIVANGSLTFKEGPKLTPGTKFTSNFRASSIIIEADGKLLAGVGDDEPYGTGGYELNIVLYGANLGASGAGAPCVMPRKKVTINQQTKAKELEVLPEDKDLADCGVPKTIWTAGDGSKQTLPPRAKPVSDFFYAYGAMHGDGGPVKKADDYKDDPDNKIGHFGYKVLALSYDGTLELRGYKGTTGGRRVDETLAAAQKNAGPLPGGQADYGKVQTGSSWMRLKGDLKKGTSTITVDGNVEGDWQDGDSIIVTTTDYLPNHSEEFVIAKGGVKGDKITVVKAAEYDHSGIRYSLAATLANAGSGFKGTGMDPELARSAETRAAVGLLTRSIRIISGGDTAKETFEQATARNPSYAFGGHTVFRQGFRKLQLQGVEFHQLGQGGKLAHYPAHFHMARYVPADTWIKDSSVSESMTRWFVLHSTNGVLLQRNVGWKSIGHGFFLESATETDNKFYANLGAYARAAVVNKTENPRNIAGILSAPRDGVNASADAPEVPYRSDITHPTIFWITNGWNEFVGNLAVGTGTCGACYWVLAAANSDWQEDPVTGGMTHGKHMKWSGYAGRQTANPAHYGETPLKVFYKNSCSTAMHALITTTDISACVSVNGFKTANQENGRIKPVPGVAPTPAVEKFDEMYYPIAAGTRAPTQCDPNKPDNDPGGCGIPGTARCDNSDPKNCATTVIDHFTTSFNWAETNFSAIWLRTPGWFVLDNSFISDVQTGGVTLVSGGDYSRSSAARGYWALVSRSVFVGQTQLNSSTFALASGPRTAAGKIACDLTAPDGVRFTNACISQAASIGFPLSNWGTNQRMFNIYDGPAHQDGNAYINIKASDCNDANSCMYFGTAGVRRSATGTTGYLPNAAIGWKQPNGFYYPPAFHSKNLFFKDVDIRHYVVVPAMQPGTYLTDLDRLKKELFGIANPPDNLFTGFTDIDRQTELNDDDGSLTGFVNTISVNEDPFFSANIQAAECRSNVKIDPNVACGGKSVLPPTARTSPLDYVTTVIYPECATSGHQNAQWTMCDSTAQGTFVAADDGKSGTRWAKREFRAGTWSKECGGPYCFGVPIYRQYLTGVKAADKDDKPTANTTREWLTWLGNDPARNKDTNCDKLPATDNSAATDLPTDQAKCNFPYARMAGAATWQRNIMTVNNGKYYIDTTRSPLFQRRTNALGIPTDQNATYVECDVKKINGSCEPRSINTFLKDQTYYLFLLFTKADTKQTYQVYVGENFKLDSVKGIRFTGRGVSFVKETWDMPVEWKPTMIKGADGKLDVMQITLDFSKVTVPLDPKKAGNEACQPLTFCKSGGEAGCGCNVDPKDPRLLINPSFKRWCEQTCKEWAVKDLDCPEIGCLGISFTMPSDFEAKNQYKRPQPEEFPSLETDPVWKNVSFIPTKEGPDANAGGTCYYAKDNTPGYYLDPKTNTRVKTSCAVPQ
ncbi:MAG: hypothetical protein WDN25_26110 [Acetobacteraceae bacterium]